MLKLYGFGKAFSMVDASPFVVKVDLFLKLAAIEYQFIADFNALKKSPKNKLPFIEDKGKKIGDSAFILKYLTEKYQLTLDDELSIEQRAQANIYSKALDESLYWCLVYSRWVKEDSWPVIKETFFGTLPAPLKWFVPGIVKKDVKKTLYRQGYGRHSESELLSIADEHFSSLAVLLSDKPFFFGEKACSFDAVAYAFLAEFISVDFFNSFNQQARKYDNLVQYCQRIEAQYYPN
ncbi:glutathione S-transferase [Thalassotalea insulae]|uniref:Glutathione S-transferase n=1 Tax=Thalassotalea insulae TaxID=2056778 RepID=A0ABQ6GTY8_9GAMM|nr:glutathione S-transferase family protein [Thalassotalea insulae]GLX79403.1 glutathione S-transferase [Thalassotalea insulae]